MKKLNKKGFTIVELVIVIAVIAILAGVLIPTFATVVEKANQSSATQTMAHAYEMAAAELAAKGEALENCVVVITKDNNVTYYATYEKGKDVVVSKAGNTLTISNVTDVYANSAAAVPTLNSVTVTYKDTTSTTPAPIANTDIAAGVYVFVQSK